MVHLIAKNWTSECHPKMKYVYKDGKCERKEDSTPSDSESQSENPVFSGSDSQSGNSTLVDFKDFTENSITKDSADQLNEASTFGDGIALLNVLNTVVDALLKISDFLLALSQNILNDISRQYSTA